MTYNWAQAEDTKVTLDNNQTQEVLEVCRNLEFQPERVMKDGRRVRE